MNGILVETDLIVEYLVSPPGEQPLLRRLLQSVTCYTTFLHAAEIYGAAGDDRERRTVEHALFGLKILGASSRYAKTIGGLLTSQGAVRGHRTAIVAAMALESKLPLITDAYLKDFSDIPGLHLIAATAIRRIPEGVSINEALVALR